VNRSTDARTPSPVGSGARAFSSPDLGWWSRETLSVGLRQQGRE
jgi:hypothetical protein